MRLEGASALLPGLRASVKGVRSFSISACSLVVSPRGRPIGRPRILGGVPLPAERGLTIVLSKDSSSGWRAAPWSPWSLRQTRSSRPRLAQRLIRRWAVCLLQKRGGSPRQAHPSVPTWSTVFRAWRCGMVRMPRGMRSRGAIRSHWASVGTLGPSAPQPTPPTTCHDSIVK